VNSPGSAPQGKLTQFITREEHLAREANNAMPYFRLDDSLCKGFLNLATCPSEVEGFKLLFPFIREMSLLRLSRTLDALPTWMYLAFMAGHDLGRARLDSLDEVLPGRELREGIRRVGVVQQSSGEEHLTFTGLQRACARIVEAKWKDVNQDELEAVLLEAVLNTLRTGFTAATFARVDPLRCEFVWDLPERIGDCIGDILSRVLVGAPRNAVGKTVVELLEHPLVRLAREYYPDKRVEVDAALGFFRGQLRALGVKSENECPASDLDLADWVAAGMNYGRLLKSQHREVVADIFDECKRNDLEGTLNTVREVVAKAEGTEPWRLVQILKGWQQHAFGWVEPRCYGDELARVVYFSDFAIWIPWVAPGPHDCPGHL
jgi:hypothetical protein